MAFYLSLEHRGRDVYPDLKRVAADRREPGYELVRFEMLRQLGYFVTESSEHFSEYVPWFIKRAQPELLDQFNIPLDEYIARCEDQIADWSGLQDEVLSGNPDAIDAYEAKRAHEMNGNWQRRLAKAFPNDDQAATQHSARYSIPAVGPSHRPLRRVRLIDHSQYGNRSSASDLRQSAEWRLDRQPPVRLLRRSPLLGRQERHPANNRRSVAARTWPRSCRPTSTSSG